MQMLIRHIDELPKAASQLLQKFPHSRVVAFYAAMGAGKTTLIKSLCTALGSTDSFSSPTYSIINEYHIAGTDQKIFHLDLYRLKSLNEAVQAGVEDCLSGAHYCFIEWPQLIEPLLPPDAVQLSIVVLPDGARQITIFGSDSKADGN